MSLQHCRENCNQNPIIFQYRTMPFNIVRKINIHVVVTYDACESSHLKIRLDPSVRPMIWEESQHSDASAFQARHDAWVFHIQLWESQAHTLSFGKRS